MTIMPFEGLMSESVEDAFGLPLTLEPSHTDADESYYCEFILTGASDEFDADREGEYFTDEDADEFEAQAAGDRWERAYWAD